jgi:DnaK suppressor protein
VNLRELEADDDRTGDAGDESILSERKEEQLREEGDDSTLLTQVREALDRIEDGTYGKCQVDGGEIEEKRLEAMPWTPYCIKHAQRLEGPPTHSATM